jgi:hypothetical protein
MGYTLNRFLRPLSDTDKTIRIFDDRNFPVQTINPFSVLRVFITNTNLNISLTGNRTITLDFSTNSECKEALFKLQSYIDILRQKTPQVIDKETQQYVQNIVQTSVGIGSLNGSTFSRQELVVNSDQNIDMSIDTVGATHSISLSWTGILPIERGGLNNTEFNNNELLIATGSQVISSGYKVNNSGSTNLDIWTAGKIISELSASKIVINIGDGVTNTFFVDHNLGTRDVIVQIYEIESGDSVETFISRKDENSIKIHFNNPPTTEEYRVIIS